MTEHFAATAAEVLAGNGLQVYLTDKATPTPVIAHAIVENKAVGGVNITASHNPPTDNGFKVRNEFGGAIPPEGLREIEGLIPDAEDQVRWVGYDRGVRDGSIKVFDPAPAYIRQIERLIDLEPIRQAGLNILVEPMWGNGAGWFPRLLFGGATRVSEIHSERNPLFPEMSRPEPIPPNVNVGLKATVERGADVLLITDGDADRLLRHVPAPFVYGSFVKWL